MYELLPVGRKATLIKDNCRKTFFLAMLVLCDMSKAETEPFHLYILSFLRAIFRYKFESQVSDLRIKETELQNIMKQSQIKILPVF